ncbi:hypothetical protein GCM10028805_01690 [Spirosoma harenae]
MKHVLLLLAFFVCSSALAQIIEIDTSEVAPPPIRRKVLTADPEDRSDQPRSSKHRSTADQESDYLLLHQLREIQTWYVGAEGGFRSDGSLLTNSLDGLLKNASQTKAVWSILVGYTYRNAWAIESGYTHAPIHLNITIPNGNTPLVYTYQNSGAGIPLRLKRRIGSGKRSDSGTGFWLTAGGWLIPNGNPTFDGFNLIGYSYSGRGNRVDTLRLTNTTKTSPITGLAEAGVDYTARLSPSFELGGYVRKFWGFGEAIRSDITYTVNKKTEQIASVTANGTGWSFGITLRYIYGKQHELKEAKSTR